MTIFSENMHSKLLDSKKNQLLPMSYNIEKYVKSILRFTMSTKYCNKKVSKFEAGGVKT